MRKILILLIVGLIAFGCAQKKIVKSGVGVEGEEAIKTSEQIEGEEAVKEIQEAEIAGQDIAKVETEELPEGYKEGEIPSFDDIYFDFDRYEIKESAKPTLKKLSSWLIDTGAKVLIEGHCDERGTNEYNLALGDRRAVAVKEYLTASGVAPSKIETLSYGEERPVCTESNEACWSKNRRAHFVITK
jgi:peptidoglycan-associated lipoprotein